MNVLIFGGSKNIGYHTALRLFAEGATVTFLIRDLRIFDENDDIRHHVALGHARLVEGDALNPDDVKAAWEKANKDDQGVDFVVFTVGTIPTFHLSKGYILERPNTATQSLLNVLCTMPKLPTPPKFVVVTSVGVTRDSRIHLPLLLRPYHYLLTVPRADKTGVERVLAYCSGRPWKGEEPDEEIMNGDGGVWSQRGRLPSHGSLKEVVIIRPPLLTDGACMADKEENSYRVSETGLNGGYRISRKDASHFIVEGALKKWSDYEGKILNIAY